MSEINNKLIEKGTKQITKNYYLHIVIIFVLMFGFGFLPVFSTITPLGMKVLGIFLSCIYAWTVGILDWSSIIALVALGLSGFTTLPEII